MNISFFEEFPTDENLEKIKLIPESFNTKIYIVSHSLSEFRDFEKKLKIPLVYWPVLKNDEGYWISPFTKRRALQRVLNEVRNEKIELMLDLENPTHAKHLYFTESLNFFRNKRFIKEFVDTNGHKLVLIELPGIEKRLKFWGLTYESETATVAKMVYTSLIGKLDRKGMVEKLRNFCEIGIKKYGNRFKMGLGCTAIGVGGSEPILTPDELEEDLKIVKEFGVNEVIIFRLGGLNEEYVKRCRKVIEN
ncbi:MAG: hypothetical protein PHX21_06460 [bacterium]|nr:hypothetical protein [bacterium]